MNFEIDNFSGFRQKVAAESNDILFAIYETLDVQSNGYNCTMIALDKYLNGKQFLV